MSMRSTCHFLQTQQRIVMSCRLSPNMPISPCFRRSWASGRDEKTKAAHDQAAMFSLEILFAGFAPRHIEPVWLSHRASPTPVGGPFGRS
jgi:hypothetical protein